VKTPDSFRREDIKKIFSQRLREDRVRLEPLEIVVTDNYAQDQTEVCFSFEKLELNSRKLYQFRNIQAQGMIDAVFTKCHESFEEEYRSLKNINLVDLVVKPVFSLGKGSLSTSASTDVTLRLKVAGYGISEFPSRSRSVVRSSFQSALEAFQFYINCDKAFHKLKGFLADARSRNREDVAQDFVSDLASLTRINSYV
tara:strand:- start:1489 stop:2082 length:594 start_codon:yes stop_codon:yes gene_type:complete